jgi:uncharacterized protein
MTPEERDLITTLLDRLKSIAGQPKDPEADHLIRRAMGQLPDAPYYLMQTVLIQDITLQQAEARIAELEEQLAAAEAQQTAPTSFLGGLFGRGRRAESSGAMPSTASRDYEPEEPQISQAALQYSRSGYGQARRGDSPGAASPGASAGGGFLRSAAITAAGLAGGALLAQGISSMFGRGNANSLSGGMRMPPGGAAAGNRDSASHGDYGGDYGGGGDDETGDGDYGGGVEGDDNYGGGDESDEDYGGDEGDEDYGGGDSDAGGDFGGGGDPCC